MLGTMLGGFAVPAVAQQAPPSPPPAPAQGPAPQFDTGAQAVDAASQLPEGQVIRAVLVEGSQRIEPDTVRSYVELQPGATYTREDLDEALRDLFETELFADVEIRDNQGELTIVVQENPVINRILLEGNRRLDDEDIRGEIRLAPRQIFTRSRARADVARIIELYRRRGRFAATVVPQMVELDQNRVDIVFEISEGPRSRVQQINVIGNEVFSDSDLRSEMATKQSRFFRFFSSSDTFDPDRLAFDQQRLRQFYLTEGYADFRVVSAVAELTPDRRDFIITYVVEEGERYRFGELELDSDLRDFRSEQFTSFIPMQTGDWYNAQQIEDTVDRLNETAGLLGYAFAETRPEFNINRDDRTMDVRFRIEQTPRVYIERIDINGNTLTRDKVIRREFRLQEGDAFNSFLVRRSQSRIQSLGFFQENFEIEQSPGSAPDRIVLTANVEENATGELQVSAGFSSLERFILNFSVRQRNFLGKGQELRAGVNYSSFSNSIELGFTEPYLFDRNIAVGVDLFRRDFDSFNFIGNDRNTTFEQISTGFQVRAGVPLTEYWTLALRYGLSQEDVTLDRNTFFINDECSPLLAGRFLCDTIGERIISSVGYSLVYNNLDNNVRPSSGRRIILSQDFAGVFGDVRYLRTRIDADQFFNIGSGFIFGLSAEAGYIQSFENRGGAGVDDVRLTDRFFLGEPQIRGFDIRGVGPRVQRFSYEPGTNNLITDERFVTDDAIGGRAYYLARAELEIPLGSGARELGFRPSIFIDAGAVFGVTDPELQTFPCLDEDGNEVGRTPCTGDSIPGPINIRLLDTDGTPLFIDSSGVLTRDPVDEDGDPHDPAFNSRPPFLERFVGDSPSPRVTIGAGVSWNSPFGPFRIDLAYALLQEEGDEDKIFSFNIGTQF
ncbi:outer membrane protein assembly factor BamA [Parasphingopyxis algicola]|uniref:outer membrane protein assembly factor BamA n=1 Tax=Parasphingopyxis algicola TaxID=2026624 RepID=UPI0015A0BF1B|nr:outer membrane protein assembly factor BamA [Parasphingopyxis algicola]QLC26781.1 outer membrane protein assembly factor BamA [Parasphingopyxis algicola]